MNIFIDIDGVGLEPNEKSKKHVREKGKSLTIIPQNYTIIDIETTGLDPQFDEIIEIAALKIQDGSIVAEFSSLVKPSGYYIDLDDGDDVYGYVSEFITDLTGITNDMLGTAPSIKDVAPKFTNFIKDDVLVGHNINFDVNFLYDTLLEDLNYKFNNDFVDLMRLGRKIYPEFKNHKLNTIAKNLGVNTLNSHRALIDCNITFECFFKLSEYVSNNSIDLDDLFRKKGKSLDLKSLQSNHSDFDKDHSLYDKFCTFTTICAKSPLL